METQSLYKEEVTKRIVKGAKALRELDNEINGAWIENDYCTAQKLANIMGYKVGTVHNSITRIMLRQTVEKTQLSQAQRSKETELKDIKNRLSNKMVECIETGNLQELESLKVQYYKVREQLEDLSK